MADFYASLPVVSDFARAVAPDAFAPAPDDWSVGFADVKGSTAAFAAGRYKAVNMIGAGVVAAVSNALKRKAFPFVFGGDGASFAVSGADAPAAEAALRAMATFAREEFELELRIAFAEVAAIRAAGRDVRVARFGASPFTAYAMFAGGGLTWLDAEAKTGRFALDPAPAGARPDLSHLSCRFGVTPARRGVILSLIVSPRGDDPRFGPLVAELVNEALAVEDGGRPVTVESLIAGPPGKAISLEAAAMRTLGASAAGSRVKASLAYGVGYLFKAFDVKLGDFDMKQYKGDLVANADFRKFDDGLRMTLDCSPEFADRIESKLAACDFVEWGTQRQTNAQITCYSPLADGRGHLHFIDGAGGGYTMAAKAMKGRRSGFNA
jgi:hypothetical protein